MRVLLLILLSLTLPALAYEGEEYPEMYENQGEVYQEESYPEESYPAESYPTDSYPTESYPAESYPEETYQESPAEEPAYQDPVDATQQQEMRNMCQEYAADMPPEEQGAYIEDCMRSQGY